MLMTVIEQHKQIDGILYSFWLLSSRIFQSVEVLWLITNKFPICFVYFYIFGKFWTYKETKYTEELDYLV